MSSGPGSAPAVPAADPDEASTAAPPTPPAAPRQPHRPAAAPAPAARAPVEEGLLLRAKRNDHEAIETMFRQFLAPGERVAVCEYLGRLGSWFGLDSFGVATDRRVAGMRVGSFGEVLYQDAPLEYVNSTVVYQPSRFGLYLTVGVVAAATLGIGLLFAPAIANRYYTRKKSGLVLNVREGVSVYLFIDRKRMAAANGFCREIARLRDERILRMG